MKANTDIPFHANKISIDTEITVSVLKSDMFFFAIRMKLSYFEWKNLKHPGCSPTLHFSQENTDVPLHPGATHRRWVP